MFHGQDPTDAVTLSIDTTIPDELVVIGACVAVEYEPLGGDKKGKLYRHEWGDTGSRKLSKRPYLCVDPNNRHRFFLVHSEGGFPVFTDRGIVGAFIGLLLLGSLSVLYGALSLV